MVSPHEETAFSTSPTSYSGKSDPINIRRRTGSSLSPTNGDVTQGLPRQPASMIHAYDLNDPEVRERQRTMDVDMAMHLSRVRRETVSYAPGTSPFEPILQVPDHPYSGMSPFISNEQHYLNVAKGEEAHEVGRDRPPSLSDTRNNHQGYDPTLLTPHGFLHPEAEGLPLPAFGIPTYQANGSKHVFDFAEMETFVTEEKKRLGFDSPTPPFTAPHSRIAAGATRDLAVPLSPVDESSELPSAMPRLERHRKLSENNLSPRTFRKGLGGKMALFERRLGESSQGTRFDSQTSITSSSSTAKPSYETFPASSGALPGMEISSTGHDRPYRFSFYSNALSATIHARSLCELPADGQTFRDLFTGILSPNPETKLFPANDPATAPFLDAQGQKRGNDARSTAAPVGDATDRNVPAGTIGDSEGSTWWLDVLSPTDEEMKMLSKVFSIHPLTTEDILMEETREKIELFRNYYLVCFRGFDQDPYSPTHLEPLNMYIIVFREGILSFHFQPTPHPQNVRRRIKQLKDYINVTSDWISYALIDDITDAFGPLIQSIEYEVDSIDELVLILRETEQSDMLRRIGTCRKKVMGMLRLVGNKADVVKGLAKRCNEHWRIAPTSDIGLYLSDIQDHLITMTQNLNHYEKILSRSHSNYLAQISIEMTEANNQINDVLSKLTALGTVLVPMNLITGLWGMNVHVPGEGVEGFAWFSTIVAALAAFAVICAYSTYRFMIRKG